MVLFLHQFFICGGGAVVWGVGRATWLSGSLLVLWRGAAWIDLNHSLLVVLEVFPILLPLGILEQVVWVSNLLQEHSDFHFLAELFIDLLKCFPLLWTATNVARCTAAAKDSKKWIYNQLECWNADFFEHLSNLHHFEGFSFFFRFT